MSCDGVTQLAAFTTLLKQLWSDTTGCHVLYTLMTTHEKHEESSHDELQTGQVSGRMRPPMSLTCARLCLNEDGCIFWIGQNIFRGPPETLNDSLDNVATPLLLFKRGNNAVTTATEIQSVLTFTHVHLCHSTDTWWPLGVLQHIAAQQTGPDYFFYPYTPH